MLVTTIVSMFGLFDMKDENDDESWRVGSHEIVAVFLLMRLFQFLLGMGLTRGETTSKSFICATVSLFIVVYLICTAIVFNTVERESSEV